MGNDGDPPVEKVLALAEGFADQAQAALKRVAELEALLNGARGFTCPGCAIPLTLCLKHGLYVRTDENQCGACRRGE